MSFKGIVHGGYIASITGETELCSAGEQHKEG